jgi:hypothetical protein
VPVRHPTGSAGVDFIPQSRVMNSATSFWMAKGFS